MLLHQDPLHRISPSELLAYLSPYSEQIQRCEGFTGDEARSMNALHFYMTGCPARQKSIPEGGRISIHVLGSATKESHTLGKDRTLQKFYQLPSKEVPE